MDNRLFMNPDDADATSIDLSESALIISDACQSVQEKSDDLIITWTGSARESFLDFHSIFIKSIENRYGYVQSLSSILFDTSGNRRMIDYGALSGKAVWDFDNVSAFGNLDSGSQSTIDENN